MHFLVPGALAYFIFDNFFIGLAVTVILSVLALFVGDWVAPMWQEYYGLEGTTCTTIIHTGWTLIVAWAMNKLIDFIPGLNKLDISLERVNKRIGVLGEPVIIGTIVGVLLGLLTRQDITTIIPMGMGVAGVMVLMPRVVGVLMDGLSPIGKAAERFHDQTNGRRRRFEYWDGCSFRTRRSNDDDNNSYLYSVGDALCVSVTGS